MLSIVAPDRVVSPTELVRKILEIAAGLGLYLSDDEAWSIHDELGGCFDEASILRLCAEMMHKLFGSF